jgi:Mor family transcriptional regulator
LLPLKITLDLALQVRREYEKEECSQIDLAKRYGIAQSSVSAIIRGKLWSQGQRFVSYNRGKNRKLTSKNVFKIRDDYAHQRATLQELAIRYNVSKSNITMIITGKSWKRVSGFHANFHGNSMLTKLSHETLEQVRADIKNGSTFVKLRRKYKLSRGAFKHIKDNANLGPLSRFTYHESRRNI